ncbi:hypothetical protein RCL1_002833 [Eukaryota sp. TZLM3-RCL]
MVVAGKLARRYTYRKVAARAFGERISKLVDTLIPLFAFGVLVAYMSILGDFLPPLIRLVLSKFGVENFDSFWYSRNFLLAISTTIIVFPLCCLRNLEPLGFSSLLALVGVLITIGGICVLFVTKMVEFGFIDRLKEVVWFNFHYSVLKVIPIIGLAFSAHFSILRLYQELHHRSVKRMFKVVDRAVSISFLCYLLCAVFGYMSFGSDTPSNLITAYEEGSFLGVMSMTCMALVVAFSYPLLQFPIKQSVVLFSPPKWGPHLHYPLTILLFILSYIGSILISDLGTILGFLGSTVGVLTSFILPPMMFLKLRKQDFGTVDHPQGQSKQAEFGVLGCYCCIALGVFVGVVGFYLNVQDLRSA